MAGATWNCWRLGAPSVCTMPPCTSLQCHFIWSHIRRVHVCLAITCHSYFWQIDQGFLSATAVTRGWNGYWINSEHRKLALEKNILPPLLPELEPETFRSRIRRGTTELSPLPINYVIIIMLWVLTISLRYWGYIWLKHYRYIKRLISWPCNIRLFYACGSHSRCTMVALTHSVT